MSSIMDELKTLQSERTGSGAPGPAETGDDGPPAGGAPVLGTPGRGRRRPPALVLGVVIALGALAAALVLPGRGGKSPPGETSTAARRDEGVPDTRDAQATTETDATELALAKPHDAAGPAASEAAGGIATPEKPADADSEGGADAEGGAAGEVDESPEGPPDEGVGPDTTTEVAEASGEAGSEPVEAAGTEPDEGAGPEPPKKVAPPVRVLTKAEDEANKVAIRGLKVFGVLVDDKGGGVYTSAGELRVGSRLNDMQVTEVTARYVIFKSCNKRYRWMLPH